MYTITEAASRYWNINGVAVQFATALKTTAVAFYYPRAEILIPITRDQYLWGMDYDPRSEIDAA